MKKNAAGDYSIAAEALEIIQLDNERLDIVLALQRHLIRSISRCESRIPRLRRARARIKQKMAKTRLSREESSALKELVVRIDKRIKEVHQQIFIWRCFGDGIAFIYQSKYALKHLFYDRDYLPKQGPGFISGKKGLRKEFKLLCMGIRMKVPVVMADLTNVIRHGDLCALAGADPLPIEIKNSSNGNVRLGRQAADLRELAAFYANDGAPNFRGMPNTARVALVNEEENYRKEMNTCISDALLSGFSIITPEEGLSYVAFTNNHAESRQDELSRKLVPYAGSSKLCTLLSPDPDWLPLYPFTLSLYPKNLIPFIDRRLSLAVLVDIEVVKRKFAALGVHAIAIMDGVHSFQLCVDSSDLTKGVYRISQQLFARVSVEFQSLDWFAREYSSIFSKQESLPSTLMTTDIDWQIPDDWRNATCLFAKS